MLRRCSLLRQQRGFHPSQAVGVLVVAFFSAAGAASDSLPADCETARDRANSKYGSVRHHFDAFNHCVSSARGDLNQCQRELDAQQSALGDFIFAQRVAQDVCGREGVSGNLTR